MSLFSNTSDSANQSRSEATGITISTLRRRRGNIIGHITSFTKILDQYSDSEPDVDFLQVSLESLQTCWTKFDEVQSDLEILDASEEPRRFEYQEKYHRVIARARKLLRESSGSVAPATRGTPLSPTLTHNSSATIKLPEIKLPSFDGSYEHWSSFFDQFSSIIDQNEAITPSQKLQYLRSALTGKAAACIASLSTTDANYIDAIEILKNKFDCTRKIILRHFDAVRDFPKLKKDTPEALGELVDHINQHLRGLKNLGQSIATWDAPLISIILSKINSDTIWHWELCLKDKKLPPYTHLLEFLERRANCTNSETPAVIPSINRSNSTRNENRNPNHSNNTRRQAFLTNIQRCPICKESHAIWVCQTFRSLPVNERINSVKKLSFCTNCLREGHHLKDCRSSSCRMCQKRHHTLLHRSYQNTLVQSIPASPETVEQTPTTSAVTEKKQSAFVIDVATNDLLVTAVVDAISKDKTPVRCRTLVDTCATAHFITERFAKALKLPTNTCSVSVGALDSLKTTSKRTVTVTIKSRVSNYERTLTFMIISEISEPSPDQPIDRSHIRIPHNVTLADPNFHLPAPIDMLIGSGTALSLLCVGQYDLTPPGRSDLYLQNTRLGWVIGGTAPAATFSRHQVYTTTAHVDDVSKFWELEDGPQIQHKSKEEVICEEHFKTHTIRNKEGRYVIALPFNARQTQLGESYSHALKRLMSLEKKFKQNPIFKQQYHAVINEYKELEQMTIKEDTDNHHEGFYLPHHAVFKESSLTTKLRVVFDGSARSSTGISLNDTLYTGPKLQEDLIHILLRFRIHPYVLTGDIEKMYRQFLVRPEDRIYQQILWRELNGDIKTYTLNTITFGLAAAPYLAIRCLQQLADDEANRFPRAAQILKRDFYVDDLLTGSSTIEEGLTVREDVKQLLNTAGLKIRQWASNDRRLLNNLPQEDINKQLQIGESSALKTLGLIWNSDTDTIHYTINTLSGSTRISKRTICSEIAKIYDPLGLLGPVIIIAKLILQRLWTLKIDWDESLPISIHTEWINFYNKLPLLNNASFPRFTIAEYPTNIQLHGFCDASIKGYGACVYLRTITSDGHIKTRLLMAKSKVAPLKQQSIPRLELCGALLLASLVNLIKRTVPIDIHSTTLWTDSLIVIHWINTSPHLLKTFVANRVLEIQTNTSPTDWRHVKTADNPADLISRGIGPEEFLRAKIWQTGPDWLSASEAEWPIHYITDIADLPEQKKQICLVSVKNEPDPYTQYSSWTKLKRIIARCLFWRIKIKEGSPEFITAINKAETAILRHVQNVHFREDIQCLTGGRSIQNSSKLLRLNPFIDRDGVLRVGGRLKNSTLPFTQKHPIILPKSHVTTLIINHTHLSQLHSGVQTTLYALRQRFWPINGRSMVWTTIKTCVRCCRFNPPAIKYIMGNLPGARVTESRPFTHVGVDFCGPFYLKERRRNNRTKIKAYVAVFVCLAVKAVHMELVSDLTTEAFIAALRRFIARRGFCTHLYSDNGSNFIGANNELQELKELLEQDDHRERVTRYLTDHSITWHFIPPHTPHFGGLWEAVVKSFKYHLRRVAGSTLFTFEAFNTLIIEIEAVLNSRPLTPISSDPQDLTVLTPGHFIIGDAMTSLRERNFEDVPINRLSSWQHIQSLKQHFWQRWHKEYLNELTQRHKWNQGSHSIDHGSLVLIRDDNVPPLHWPLGRVTQVHPGSDGIVRTVTVKTATNTLKRCVNRLVLLPINQEREEEPPPAP